MTTYSVDTYTGDGSSVDFGVSFPFLQRSHVEVYRIDIASKVATKLAFVESGPPTGDEYIWVTDEQITVGTAPALGEELKIQRDTPENQQLVQWVDGSYIVAEDLNESDKQWLYNIQELEDQISDVAASSVDSVSGSAPITVDNTDAENPVVGIDQVDSTVNPNIGLTSDTDVMSAKAADLAFSQEVGDGSSYPPAGATGKEGKLRVDLTDGFNPELYAWSGGAWKQLPTKGDKGDTGDVGPAPGLQEPPADATTVPLKPDGTTGDATASVQQDPDTKDLKFTFGVPVGKTGERGPIGLTGTAATISAGSATSLGYAQPPTVTNSGSTSAAVFNFGIPKGEPQKIATQDAPPAFIAGEPVKDGDLWLNTQNGQLYVYYTDADSFQWLSVSKVGPQGPAATVDAGKTETAAPGDVAVVTNSGTTSAAIFDFKIPRGEKGDEGPRGYPGADGADSNVPGPAGTIEVGSTTTLAAGSAAYVTNDGSITAALLNFGIPRGDKGEQGLQGPQGPTATVDVGYSNSISYKADAYVTNTGSADAAVFNFGIPKGAPQRCLVQDTPPVEIDGNPVENGDTWFSSQTGQLYVYYTDADSSQWVSVAKTGPPGRATVATTSPGGPQIGELWFDENIDKLKVYTSTGWKLAN